VALIVAKNTDSHPVRVTARIKKKGEIKKEMRIIAPSTGRYWLPIPFSKDGLTQLIFSTWDVYLRGDLMPV
jgi:hypothetical protein